MHDQSRRIYYPGLNGLRFFAAFVVLMTHVNQAHFFYNMHERTNLDQLLRAGSLAVSFFFALSGFLITSLLLEERKLLTKIDIKKFYIRRALRIWPLYFFVAFLGLVLLPLFPAYHVPTFGETFDSEYWKKILLYLFLSPHVVGGLAILPYASLLWSIGVEEWFYLFWPWIAKFGRRIVVCASVTILAIFGFDHITGAITSYVYFLPLLRFDCMALGALAALSLTSRNVMIKHGLKIVFSPVVQISLYTSILALFFSSLKLGSFEHMFFSLLFSIIILNVGANPRTIFRLENPILKWLGERSYGIYCYNWMAAVSAVLIARLFDRNFQDVPVYGLTVILGIGFTLILAAISYSFLESPFLRLKSRNFTTLKTK